MRLGLFGGTFDPPHTGHLIVAQDARQQLTLDRIVFIPAAIPPHKRGDAVTEAGVRLEMVRSAIAGDRQFEVDDLEIRRGGASYTVDTLRTYRSTRPEAELFLLLGADQYAEIETWRETREVRRLARLAVMARAGEAPAELAADVLRVEVTRVDISATEVRRRVSCGESIRYLVPERVEALIRKYRLYLGATG